MKNKYCIVMFILLLILLTINLYAAEDYKNQQEYYLNDTIFMNVLASDTPEMYSDGDTGILGGLLDGLKNLFVPDELYFKNFFKDIQSVFDSKFGGIKTFMNNLKIRFEDMFTTEPQLLLKFPQKHLFSNFKVDMLGAAKPFITLIKAFFSCFFIIFVTVFSYKKIIKLIGR